MEVHVEHLVIEEEDSPSMRELVEQIESHTKVIDLEYANLPVAPKVAEAAEATLGLAAPVTNETLVTPSATEQDLHP